MKHQPNRSKGYWKQFGTKLVPGKKCSRSSWNSESWAKRWYGLNQDAVRSGQILLSALGLLNGIFSLELFKSTGEWTEWSTILTSSTWTHILSFTRVCLIKLIYSSALKEKSVQKMNSVLNISKSDKLCFVSAYWHCAIRIPERSLALLVCVEFLQCEVSDSFLCFLTLYETMLFKNMDKEHHTGSQA